MASSNVGKSTETVTPPFTGQETLNSSEEILKNLSFSYTSLENILSNRFFIHHKFNLIMLYFSHLSTL